MGSASETVDGVLNESAEDVVPVPATHAEITDSSPLPRRALAMLRAVAAGRAELRLSCEPDMFVDGVACCDQFMAHDLARAQLVRPARLGLVGHRVPAILTYAGRAMLRAASFVA